MKWASDCAYNDPLSKELHVPGLVLLVPMLAPRLYTREDVLELLIVQYKTTASHIRTPKNAPDQDTHSEIPSTSPTGGKHRHPGRCSPKSHASSANITLSTRRSYPPLLHSLLPELKRDPLPQPPDSSFHTSPTLYITRNISHLMLTITHSTRASTTPHAHTPCLPRTSIPTPSHIQPLLPPTIHLLPARDNATGAHRYASRTPGPRRSYKSNYKTSMLARQHQNCRAQNISSPRGTLMFDHKNKCSMFDSGFAGYSPPATPSPDRLGGLAQTLWPKHLHQNCLPAVTVSDQNHHQ